MNAQVNIVEECMNIFVEDSQQDLEQVQADEIQVKTQKGTYWMALALAVRTRLWLGGVVSRKRIWI